MSSPAPRSAARRGHDAGLGRMGSSALYVGGSHADGSLGSRGNKPRGLATGQAPASWSPAPQHGTPRRWEQERTDCRLGARAATSADRTEQRPGKRPPTAGTVPSAAFYAACVIGDVEVSEAGSKGRASFGDERSRRASSSFAAGKHASSSALSSIRRASGSGSICASSDSIASPFSRRRAAASTTPAIRMRCDTASRSSPGDQSRK